MRNTDRLTEYLRGERRGKAANRLEREALSDPFLFEALEGLTAVGEEVPKEIESLSVRLRKRVRSGWHFSRKGWGIAAAFLGVGIVLWITLPRKDKTVSLAAVTLSADQKTGSQEEQALVLPATAKTDREMSSAQQVTEAKKADLAADRAQAVTFSRAKVVAESSRVAPVKAEIAVKIENSGANGSMPLGGIEAFDRYIRDSLVYPEDALQQHLQGDIRLSFIVNKKGRPSHIRVVQWITHSCNHEAIRLLDQGPAWTYTGSEEPTYITIPFRLPPVASKPE